MRRARLIVTVVTAVLHACLAGGAVAADDGPGPARAFLLPEKTDALLDRYCYSCHDEETQKGDIRLDHLSSLDGPKRLDLLNRMQEQLYFRHMPPKKKRSAQRRRAGGRSGGPFRRAGTPTDASTLEGKLQKPEYGNYVDHRETVLRRVPRSTGLHLRPPLVDQRVHLQCEVSADPEESADSPRRRRGQKVPVFGSQAGIGTSA